MTKDEIQKIIDEELSKIEREKFEKEGGRMEKKMFKSKMKLDKVDNFTKYVMAVAAGKGDIDKALNWAKNNEFEEIEKALTISADSGTGHFLVPDEWASEIIELLRPAVTVRKLGAQTVPLVGGTLHIPAMIGGGSAEYLGESEDISITKPEFSEKTLIAKKLAAIVPISNDLLRKAAYNVLNIVRNDLINAIAVREDKAFLYDTGVPATTIKGLKQLATVANRVFASDGSIAADIAKAEKALKDAHIRFVRPGIIMSSRTENYLKYYYEPLSGTYPYLEEMKNGTIFGYPYAVSYEIPINLPIGTTETNGTELFFVDFNEVIIGDGEQIYVDISTEAAYKDGVNVISAFSKDQTLIRVITENDMILRHDKAAVVISPLNWDVPTV